MSRRNKQYLSIILIIAIIVILGAIFIYLLSETEMEEEEVIDTNNWKTYTNEHYGFTLKYPENWKVYEAPADPVAPSYNIYKPGSGADKLPYDHHTESVTHVSVFPMGIPTEGVFGESTGSDVNFGVQVINARNYVLDDGTSWSTMTKFDDPPATWNESGFLYSAVNIQNLKAVCMRDGEKITNEQCEPLFGDMVVRQGKINQHDRRITEEIMESFRFIEDKVKAESSYRDLIRIDHPLPESTISSPLTIEGEARGMWYFEGSFPVVLTNWDGMIIAEGSAQAQDDWMTTSYVPFEVTLRFDVDTSVSDRGSLILQKDNPSGKPENADAFEFFVFFDKTDTPSYEEGVSLAYLDIAGSLK